MNKDNPKKNIPLLLLILDGWGIREEEKGNPIVNTSTPFYDSLIKKYPNTSLFAHGKYVGLPDGQVGNSEAGHTNIGAGRLIEQDVVRISRSIKDETFFRNPAFDQAIKNVKKNNSSLHIAGLLSNGMSPHSDPSHLLALLKLAREKKVKKVFLHIFTDGRDSPKYAALNLIEKLEEKMNPNEQIATVMGRFYAMDRKKSWERTEMAYNALVSGEGIEVFDAKEAVTQAYNRGLSDEFIKPHVICAHGKAIGKIKDKDSVIFFNLRSDRARQLTKVFGQKNFNKKNIGSFKKKKEIKDLVFISLTDFGPDLEGVLNAYPHPNIKETLPMQLNDFRQLYISETEKYAHVTYFFNGGYSGTVSKEDQVLVPSPNVDSYDKTPLMSTNDLVKKIVHNVKTDKYDFTVLNLAAPDMIGHTGNYNAGVKCVEGIDHAMKKIITAYLEKNGIVLLTADHGNIEQMINPETDEIFTEHTANKVPLILISKSKNFSLLEGGRLGDIAPTILDILNIKKPKEMTGKSLLNK